MNIAHHLEVNASATPQAPALYVGDALRYRFSDLLERVHQLAGLLASHDLQPGDRLAIYMKNRPAYLETMLAAWQAGLVVVPINAKLHWREVDHILGDSGAGLLICDRSPDIALEHEVPRLDIASPAFLVKAAPLSRMVERAADDPAWIFYTSGTTGRPKGATLSHRNLKTMARCYLRNVDKVEPHHVLAHLAPMSHGSGIYLLPYLMRGCAQLVPASASFDVAELIHLINQRPGLSMFLAPTMIRRLIDHLEQTSSPVRLDHLHVITYGGAPMYERDLRDALALLGPRLVQIYGQGESPMTISVLGRDEHERYRQSDVGACDGGPTLVPVGRAHPELEVRVTDEAGKALPTGQEGEIRVRGDTVMLGYWNNPQATKDTLHDGWLCTGDIGRVDERGLLTLTDRAKDVIISGGSNIYPREVEEALLSHPAVHEASVIGASHPDWGEQVVAFVALHQPVDLKELDDHCLSCLARFKRPRHYEIVDELPKNAYGKILKTALRERFAQHQKDS